MSIKIDKGENNYRKIFRVSMVIVMADSIGFSGNSSIHFDTYPFQTSHNPSVVFNDIVAGYPSNFGIDSNYIVRGTLDQQCLLGLYRIFGNYG